MAGVARVVGGAVAQVGIKLVLEKAVFNKDVQQTTKQAESAFSRTFGKVGKTMKSAFSGKEMVSYSKQITFLERKLNDLKATISMGKTNKNLFSTSEMIQMEAEAESLQNQLLGLKSKQNTLENAFPKGFKKILSTTKTAFAGIGNIVSNAMSKVKDKVQETFHKVGNIIKGALLVGSAFMIKFGKDAVQVASETQSAWTGLNSIVTGTGKSFSEAQEFLKEYTKDGLIPLTDAVASYKNLASRGYDTEQIEGIMTALKDASAFGRQASYSYGEAIKTATEGLKNENSILVDNAGVTKNVAKMWDEYAQSIGTTANNLTLAQKRLAEYNGIMEETKFQTGDAQRYADTYAGKLAKVSTAFYNLKVAVGQVVAPIVELFLPVIERSINALTRLFNKVKSVMSVFGLEMKEYIGKDASSAISGATDSTSALSSGLDSAGDTATATAKKIKKAFAGVDEINVLNMGNDNSSGSGGSGGTGGSSGGTGIDTGSSIIDGLDDTQEKVTQNLEWLTRSAYDWGVKFGEALNKGMNAIPWDKIQGTVNNVVGKVAEFLNGAVEGLDWHLLGSTFGNGFNTIIYGLNTWYETFDWSNLGTKLGEGVNGIIDTIDFEAIGHYFSLKFNSIFEVASNFLGTVKWGDLGTNIISGLNTFIAELDFSLVGKTLENGLNGAIDLMWNAVRTFDAKKAGEQFASLFNNISTAIKNTDWKKLGETLSEGFHKAIVFLKEWIKNTDWGELVKNIIDGIVKFAVGIDWGRVALDLIGLTWEVGKALVEGIWQGIKSAIVGVGKILYDILIQPIVDGVKSLFGINSPSTVFAEIGKYLIEGLWSGISGAKDWIVGKWNEVKGWFSDIVKTASVKITQKWKDIKQSWTDLTSNIKNKTADMKAKVATKWKDIKKNWTDITSNIKNKTADMKAKVKTKWSDIKKNWTNITNNIKDKTASMKAKIGTKWSNLKNTWNNLMSNFKDKTITIKAKVGEVVGSFKGTINDKLIKPINNKLPNWMAKIPYLAQGSWFAKNNPTLAVVGDNKKEPEIVTPESKIYEQTRKAVEDAGTGTTQNIEFTINVKYEDGKSIIKKINSTQIKDGKISLLV